MAYIGPHELRRVRSNGDVPRRPESIHTSRSLRRSSDVNHLPSATHPQSVTYAEPIARLPPTNQSTESFPPLIASLPTPPTVEEPDDSPLPLGAVPRPPVQPRRSFYRRTLDSLGIGRGATRARRSLVALLLNLTSGSLQIIIISTLLALCGTRFKSPTQPELTEWKACSKPLGAWVCIWVGRAFIATSLNYWGFLRDRQERLRNSTNTPPANSANNNPPLPHTLLYSRLTLFSSLLTLTWFLTAHILEYTSINTCRHSSPHLWWLTFGILCLMYLMVLEVVLLGFIVFIIAPILFLFWNIVLICIGRHPLQTNNMIRPEIGKLPKSIVDRIPLVMYIPPPPEISSPEASIPKPSHQYPPKPAPSAPRSRFKLIRRFGKKNGDKDTPKSEAGSKEKDVEKNEGEPMWEEYWERGEYPFVVLEGNRAACAICLMDFEEPKRIIGASETPGATPATGAETGDEGVERPSISEVPAEMATATVPEPPRAEDELHLTDAGEGAQPLRLLECGHVYHKTCLDPWLIDVSGRCPVCQQPVEYDRDKKPKKRERRR